RPPSRALRGRRPALPLRQRQPHPRLPDRPHRRPAQAGTRPPRHPRRRRHRPVPRRRRRRPRRRRAARLRAARRKAALGPSPPPPPTLAVESSIKEMSMLLDSTEASRGLMPQPCQLVIFGAPGDLAWRKLLPAVYNLNVDGLLPSHFAVVGFGLGSQGDPDEWLRNRARDGANRFSRRHVEEALWADFARALFYVEGSFN